ncbi:hypothetical protein V6N12_037235 [Hibiscus sabdariffa]|uniref:Uncharacterized protein n=1 Tax=Hibiscus sabdariffa TaxID=183260 RepID=A0ABR2C3L6_9ROSI
MWLISAGGVDRIFVSKVERSASFASLSATILPKRDKTTPSTFKQIHPGSGLSHEELVKRLAAGVGFN